MQTPVYPPRERGTMTEPPPRADASGHCSDWAMHDAYVADLERRRFAKEQAEAKSSATRKEAASSTAGDEGQAALDRLAQVISAIFRKEDMC